MQLHRTSGPYGEYIFGETEGPDTILHNSGLSDKEPDTRHLIDNISLCMEMWGNGPHTKYLIDNVPDARCHDIKLPTYSVGCGQIKFSYYTGNEANNICFYFAGSIHSPILLSEVTEDKMGAVCLQGKRPIVYQKFGLDENTCNFIGHA